MTMGNLFLFYTFMPSNLSLLSSEALKSALRYPRTIAFATIILFQMFNVYSTRSEFNSVFKSNIPFNKILPIAISSSLLLLGAVIYIPGLQLLFKTVPLSLNNWIIIVLVASTNLWVIELRKLWKRKKLRKKLEKEINND